MPRILVLYASTHGHTAKIAARIAATLEHDGATVDLHQLGAKETEPAPAGYDAVILGAWIHAGHHQRAFVKWAEQHHTALGLIRSACFSVCLTAADDTEESRAATRGYLDGFVEQTGWMPDRSATFAGAVQYHEYDLATRVLMRPLMRRMHHPTDASQDYDYTDWDTVERWAHELAATLTPRSFRTENARSSRGNTRRALQVFVALTARVVVVSSAASPQGGGWVVDGWPCARRSRLGFARVSATVPAVRVGRRARERRRSCCRAGPERGGSARRLKYQSRQEGGGVRGDHDDCLVVTELLHRVLRRRPVWRPTVCAGSTARPPTRPSSRPWVVG